MFKILLLQRWYNLSDPAVEQALLDRLSFLRFIEFSLDEEMPEDRSEDETPEKPTTKYQTYYSDDKEAAWLRKRKREYYGYKLHAVTGSHNGFLLSGHITPANYSDTGEFEKLVADSKLEFGQKVYADKGYCSVRQIVERAFGTLKRGYGFCRSRYVGQAKVEGEFHIIAMAFNLKKTVHLLQC